MWTQGLTGSWAKYPCATWHSECDLEETNPVIISTGNQQQQMLLWFEIAS
jgi:hypothetical protein